MTIEKKVLQVGLIMPIATIGDCTAEHWADVKSILIEALQSNPDYECQVKLVSEEEYASLIHQNIVRNIYFSDIVICDVSCKNPNVMFELGMRLAFNKPTVIVKDDFTDYSFDTAVIEHVGYPRDLRFKKIVDFKATLARKVFATYENSIADHEHSTFLKNFGDFKVAVLTETAVPADKLMVEMLTEMRQDLIVLKNERVREKNISISTRNMQQHLLPILKREISRFLDSSQLNIDDLTPGNFPISFNEFLGEQSGKSLPPSFSKSMIIEAIDQLKNERAIDTFKRNIEV